MIFCRHISICLQKGRAFSALPFRLPHVKNLLDYLLYLAKVQASIDIFIFLHLRFDIFSQSQEVLHTTLPFSPIPVYLVRIGGKSVWFCLMYPF